MCGLAGIIAWHERFRVDRSTIERASACLAHRGPDADGLYTSPDVPITVQRPQVALAHRRLAILDLDRRADQPFADDLGRLLVFNGEIYNFRELRRELATLLPQYAWRTECDTEVLLTAYAAWGRECLSRLNGMFAFAIFDPTPTDGWRLLLARDRMGQKPLYYALADGAIAFASEPAALRQVAWVNQAIDMQALSDYLTWGFTPRGTIYRGIRKLAPASWMSIENGAFDSHRYFNCNDPPTPCRDLSDADPVRQTRELVTQAVRRQLVADVPLGCFLSGGTDSSVISAAMRKIVPRDQPVLTFCIGFDDPLYDERRYAAEVARRIGTQHHEFLVKPDAAADLPKLATTFGEPFGDSSALPTHYLSRETRGHVTVALSGDGGDELFGGYDRYRAMALGQRLARIPRPLTTLAGMPLDLFSSHPKSAAARLRRLLATLHLPPAQRYASYLEFFDPPTVARLLSQHPQSEQLADSSLRILSERYDLLFGPPLCGGHMRRDVVQAALAADREFYLPEDLLTKVDRCSMLHALEVRSPFMDHDLVQFAAGLSTAQLIRGGGKRLLREAFAADLPDIVFTRRKMGFAVPLGQWLRRNLRDMLHDAIFSAGSFARST